MLMESVLSSGANCGPSWAGSPVWSGTAFYVDAVVRSAFDLRADAIHGTGRSSKRVAFARQVAMYLMHTQLGLTLTEAGRYYGRDRTTVSHGCRAVEERREDVATDALVEWLERAVRTWIAADVGGRS